MESNEDFEIVQLNEKGEEIIGYDESELRGRAWEKIVSDARVVRGSCYPPGTT